MNWQKISWGLIIGLALVLRGWGYDKSPVGLAHDEIHQIVNAKSILLTGREAAGTAAGIFNNDPHCDGNCIFGDLPSYLLVPFAILPTSYPWSKLPFLGLSLLMVYLGGKLFENLTGNRKIGMAAGLMMAINPWSINFGRTAYENLFAFTFYLGSLYWWTKRPIKIKYQIGAIVLGLAASLSYFGAKPIFVPLMWLGLIYGYINEKKNLRKYFILGGVTILLMVGYGVILSRSAAGARLKETKLISSEVIEQVNEERRMSLEMPVIRDMFINKYTVLFKILAKKYFWGLAPNYLFNEGELGYDHFMIAGHAFMYLVDLPLILVGLYFLFKRKLGAGLFLVGIILILPITPVVSNYATTYALRSGLTYPILAGIAGIGVYKIVNLFKKKKLVVIGLTVMYAASLINFEVMYWYRNPFERSVGFVFYEREVARYLNLINKGSEIQVTTNTPVDVIYEYAVFTGKINNKEFVKEMNMAISDGTYLVDGIKFTKTCPQKIDDKKIYLLERQMDCVAEPNRLARISEPKDGGARYFIPNEKLCEGITLGAYPYPRKIDDFSIEKMSKMEFCQKWISKP